MLKLAYKVGSRGGAMVITSARNAGDPWFESRLWYDRFLYINIHLFIHVYIYTHTIRGMLTIKKREINNIKIIPFIIYFCRNYIIMFIKFKSKNAACTCDKSGLATCDVNAVGF